MEMDSPKLAEVKQYLRRNEYFSTIKDIDEYAYLICDTYLTKDIIQELKKAYLWVKSNPNRQKKNYRKYLTNWFSRAWGRR